MEASLPDIASLIGFMFHEDSVYDEENELLLLSDFSRDSSNLETGSFIRRTATHVEIQVSIRVLCSLPSSNASDEICITATSSTVYTQNLDLPSKLGVDDGQLCLLKSRGTRKSTSNSTREHPVTLTVLSPNYLLSPLSDSFEIPPEDDYIYKIYVPPCIAASVGFYDCIPLSKSYSLSPLQFCDGSQVHSITQLATATSATLREVSPPPCDTLPDFHSILLNNSVAQQSRLEKRRLKIIHTLQNYFARPLLGNKSLHVMNKQSWVAIDDEISSCVRFYEIEDFQLLDKIPDDKKLGTESTCFVLSPDTRLVLLPQGNGFVDFQPCRRLPHADSVRRFYRSIMKIGSSSADLPDSCSHPSFQKVVDALLQIQVYGKMQNQHSFENSTLAVVGHEDNHLNRCLDAAAITVGMRIIHIRGLAAFGFRAQSLLSDKTSLQSVTGSTRDKLIGLVAAFDCARRSAPCILHISLDGEILCSENREEEYESQNRLLSCLKEELKQNTRAVSGLSSIDIVPSVQLVLSTPKHITEGPLLSNLIHDVVHISSPDVKYARILWSDDHSFDKVYLEYLQGRCASEILYIKQAIVKNISNSSLDALTQNVLAICKTMEDGMIGAFHEGPSNSRLCKVPDVRWEDIGGLQHVRKEVFDAIELPLQHPTLFTGQKRKGILLHGPPGSGKTLVAKAVATEYGLPFISIKGPELLGSYVGESEANIRNVFSMARQAASMSTRKNGAILFFDEIDSLAPHRGQKHDGGGIMDRVTVTFLGELDMVTVDNNENVYVICATNRPDLLDPSLLRPGRLDKIVYLGLPDSREDRTKILAAQCRRFTFENHQDSYDMAKEVIDSIPPNLSGADLASISSAAIMKSIERICQRAEVELSQKSKELNDATLDIEDILSSWNESDFIPIVTREDFVSVSLNIVPSIHQDDLKIYEKLKTSFI